jgi:aryl-alcohol dehydrogenase-like predicted oxidoreductase
MEHRPLGQSGISVSAMSLGSWMTYESMDEKDALAVMQAGLDAGINFLDDARYNDRTGKAPLKTGYSEVLFGNLFRRTGRNRADTIIANKLWFEFYPTESIEAELDGSLGRLGMDYLDIVFCDARPASLPLLDMIVELDRLITSGKLRAWGVLNWPVDAIAEAVREARTHGLRPPSAAQLAYSVLTPSPVEDAGAHDVFHDGGVGVVASYSLYGGLLSGKYRSGVSEGRLAGQLANPAVQAMLPKVDAFVRIADDVGCTPSQLALAYCLRNPDVSSLLFGSKQVAQVRENVGALDVAPRLTAETMSALRSLASRKS